MTNHVLKRSETTRDAKPFRFHELQTRAGRKAECAACPGGQSGDGRSALAAREIAEVLARHRLSEHDTFLAVVSATVLHLKREP